MSEVKYTGEITAGALLILNCVSKKKIVCNCVGVFVIKF